MSIRLTRKLISAAISRRPLPTSVTMADLMNGTTSPQEAWMDALWPPPESVIQGALRLMARRRHCPADHVHNVDPVLENLLEQFAGCCASCFM